MDSFSFFKMKFQNLSQLTTLSDCFSKELLNMIMYFLNCEVILYQHKIYDEQCLLDMMTISVLLEKLDLYDLLEKRDATVSGRRIICDFLNNDYSLAAFIKNDREIKNKKPSIENTENLQLNNKWSEDIVLPLNYEYDSCDAPSTRKKIRKFLEYMVESNYVYVQPTSNSENHKKNVKTHYSVSISEVPELLLLYQLYDGRVYRQGLDGLKTIHSIQSSKKQQTRLTRKSFPDSFYSYSCIMEQIHGYILQSQDTNLLVHRYRLEKIFKYNTFNLLRKYYRKYMDINMISSFAHTYELTEREVRIIFDTYLFNDDLLNIILKSPLIDPLLLMDIELQTQLNFPKELLYSNRSLQKTIADCISLIKPLITCDPPEKYIATLLHMVKPSINKPDPKGLQPLIESSEKHITKDITLLKKQVLDELHSKLAVSSTKKAYFYDLFSVKNEFVEDWVSIQSKDFPRKISEMNYIENALNYPTSIASLY